MLKSFEGLDKLGWIQELPEEQRRAVLAGEYTSALERNETAVVAAQTWNEVRAVHQAIREELKKTCKLGAGASLETYQVIDCTEAQKRTRKLYTAGHHVCFAQRYGWYAKGNFCAVVRATDKGIVIPKNGRVSTVSYRHADRLTVASGDRLQLKFNGKS